MENFWMENISLIYRDGSPTKPSFRSISYDLNMIQIHKYEVKLWK